MVCAPDVSYGEFLTLFLCEIHEKDFLGQLKFEYGKMSEELFSHRCV
jgi:hypothetical protein